MDDAPLSVDGQPAAGWVLRSTDAAAVVADFKEFGQVFRFPVPEGDRTDLMAAGQPCFLYVAEPGNPDVKPGIWAVGEVVGPASISDDDTVFAEVELLPLQQRIALGALNDHRVLAASELLSKPDRDNPFVLRSEELRALEEWDFELREPTPEQEARLDEVLAEDDGGVIFHLRGLDHSLVVVDDGADDLLAVVTVDSDDNAYEVGRYEAFADAVEAIATRSAELELPPTEGGSAEGPEGEPVAVLDAADGPIGLYRSGEEFVLWDGTELARFESLTDALTALAAAVEEV